MASGRPLRHPAQGLPVQQLRQTPPRSGPSCTTVKQTPPRSGPSCAASNTDAPRSGRCCNQNVEYTDHPISSSSCRHSAAAPESTRTAAAPAAATSRVPNASRAKRRRTATGEPVARPPSLRRSSALSMVPAKTASDVPVRHSTLYGMLSSALACCTSRHSLCSTPACGRDSACSNGVGSGGEAPCCAAAASAAAAPHARHATPHAAPTAPSSVPTPLRPSPPLGPPPPPGPPPQLRVRACAAECARGSAYVTTAGGTSKPRCASGSCSRTCSSSRWKRARNVTTRAVAATRMHTSSASGDARCDAVDSAATRAAAPGSATAAPSTVNARVWSHTRTVHGTT
eukprot:365555-Chlamydomonas_euryale.AAC.19